MSTMTRTIHTALLLATLWLVGCSNEPAELTAAPLGQRPVLESLADSYTAVSNEKLSTSPMNLPGKERKHFVEEVFARSGYSYSKTLHRMAQDGIDKTNQLHVDLAELVLMPHRSPRFPLELTDIYSAQELQDVAVVERQLNQR